MSILYSLCLLRKGDAVKIINAPVHIVTGSAGCQEGRDHFLNKEPKWSAFRSQDFGYTKFKAYNKTHLYMEQISVDLHGRAIDSLWLVKHKPKPKFSTEQPN